LIKPFTEKQLNFVQMLNECFLLLSVYMMFLFCDFVPDEATRYRFGWYFVYLVFIIFGANMLIIGGHMLMDICEMSRRYWTKRTLKRKIMHALEEKRKRARERQNSIKSKSLQRRNRNGLLESIKELADE
jgi:signal transduction histidine kinase